MESLVLNIMTIPVSIVPYRRAVTLVRSEKAIVIESYPDTLIRSASFSMQIPSVIQCTHSDYIPKKYVKVLPFTRKNVYLRDHGRCQYCGHKVGLNSPGNYGFSGKHQLLSIKLNGAHITLCHFAMRVWIGLDE